MRLEQRHLDPGLAPSTDEAGRDDPGIVQNEQVARTQEIGQVPDLPIRKPGRADMQKSGGVARLDRVLRDQVRRQLEIERIYPHRAEVRPVRPLGGRFEIHVRDAVEQPVEADRLQLGQPALYRRPRGRCRRRCDGGRRAQLVPRIGLRHAAPNCHP
jgi:hypothetical protein